MKLIRWNVTPSALLVSIVALIQLAILTAGCLKELDHDHFDKERVIDQLCIGVGNIAWSNLSDEIRSKTTPLRAGEVVVLLHAGLEKKR
jgi:hypothetical protein